MTPSELQQLRRRHGLSASEMSAAIGYREDDGRTVRNLEAGAKNGYPFALSGPAEMSILRMSHAHAALLLIDTGQVELAKEMLRAILPERMTK